MLSKFVVFIITHGRPHNITTLNTIRRCGYSGEIVLIVDNEDACLQDYLQTHDNVVVFDKKLWVNNTDYMCRSPKKAAAVFARNFVEFYVNNHRDDINSFIVMDDDISNLYYRFIEQDKLLFKKVESNLDDIFSLYLNYMLSNDISMMGLGNEASYIGGKSSFLSDCKRRCFQIFMRNKLHEVQWRGNLNEDSITCVKLGRCGKVVLESMLIKFEAIQTGKGFQPGGMYHTYHNLINGHQAQFSVMDCPSGCRAILNKRGDKFISSYTYNSCVPKIISSKYKVIDKR